MSANPLFCLTSGVHSSTIIIRYGFSREVNYMNKQELIASIAKSTDLPKSKVNDVIDAFLGDIKTSLKKGKPVQLVGFGTWKKSKRKARTGRNPQTGASIKIAARNTVRFSAGKAFKDLIN